MSHITTSYLQTISNALYHLAFGYRLSARPNQLAWALNQPQNEVLKYTFQEGSGTYSILEYAVQCQDINAVRTLFDRGANSLVNGTSSCIRNIVDFYMECLEEHVPPNLDILNLLLDHSDVNSRSYAEMSHLEHAVDCMKNYETMHLEVIEALFKKGAHMPDGTLVDPFEILKDHPRCRTATEERVFMNRLYGYLSLERKYHPTSKAGLTLDEFTRYTVHLRATFTRSSQSTNTSLWLSERASSLQSMLESAEEKTHPDMMSAIQATRDFQQDLQHNRGAHCIDLYDELVTYYYRYFCTLVREGAVKDCFEEGQLATIQSIAEKLPSWQSQPLLRLLKCINPSNDTINSRHLT